MIAAQIGCHPLRHQFPVLTSIRRPASGKPIATGLKPAVGRRRWVSIAIAHCFPDANGLSLYGEYSSAVLVAIGVGLTMPPAKSTWPLGRRVAVNSPRVIVIVPVRAVNVPVVGL